MRAARQRVPTFIQVLLVATFITILACGLYMVFTSYSTARAKAQLIEILSAKLHVAQDETAIRQAVYCGIFADGMNRDIAEHQLRLAVGDLLSPYRGAIVWYRFVDTNVYLVIPHFYVRYDSQDSVVERWIERSPYGDYEKLPVVCNN
jgi:hypothetical protein